MNAIVGPMVELDSEHLRRNRVISFDRTDPMSMCYDVLRIRVMQKLAQADWRSVGVVSPVPECGKTVTAINLAIGIAQYAERMAILIDFDLRRPKVAKYLGISPPKSLNEVFAGGARLSEALVGTGLPRLLVATTSRPVPRPAETLASKATVDLVGELKAMHPEAIIVFDLPPILSSDDAITILPLIDSVLMVVGDGLVSKGEMDETMHNIRTSNLVGVVLNKAEVPLRKYYY